ncbi:MAG: permease [Candidatus Uhrbacteria bacterium]|nr:permease [Candidatus Uhrbacteria bacterium]
MFFDEFTHVLIEYAWQVLPWFFAGLLIAIVVEKRFANKKLPSYFCEYRPLSVATLLLVGMISPLSILSGLPLVMQLLRQGAHPALLLSFFAAERVYDLQSFPIIGGIFGWKFAIINVLIVFIALFVAAWSVKWSVVAYHARPETTVKHDGWKKHVKMLLVVVVGITIAALFRVLVPEHTFAQYAGGLLGSVLTALLIGLSIYMGTIIGIYPLANAFSDLGMLGAGLMTFLSASSLLNVVIIALFLSSISPRAVLKYFIVYGGIATALSMLFGVFIY